MKRIMAAAAALPAIGVLCVGLPCEAQHGGKAAQSGKDGRESARTDVIARQNSNASAGKESHAKDNHAKLDLNVHAKVETSASSGQGSHPVNHGDLVSSERHEAIEAWKARGKHGPPPWAGEKGGPGGNPNHQGQGKDFKHAEEHGSSLNIRVDVGASRKRR